MMPKTTKKPTASTKKNLTKKKKSVFSWKYAAVFIALAVAIGGYIVYRSYAGASPTNLKKILPAADTGQRLVWGEICQSGQNMVFVRFVVLDYTSITDFAPELVFARNGVRTGQITGSRSWVKSSRGAAYVGQQTLGNRSMGNRKSTDTVKVKFGNYQSGTLRWNQIPYCAY